jgi:hypothetical protein
MTAPSQLSPLYGEVRRDWRSRFYVFEFADGQLRWSELWRVLAGLPRVRGPQSLDRMSAIDQRAARKIAERRALWHIKRTFWEVARLEPGDPVPGGDDTQ